MNIFLAIISSFILILIATGIAILIAYECKEKPILTATITLMSLWIIIILSILKVFKLF